MNFSKLLNLFERWQLVSRSAAGKCPFAIDYLCSNSNENLDLTNFLMIIEK